MKKFLKILLVLILLLLAALYCLLFTQFGNNILKPIIESKAKEASGMDIKLDKFSLRFNSVDVEATLMEHIKGKVIGGINLFSQSFDLNYSVNADSIPEIQGIKINEPLSLNGKAIGDIKDFQANGNGDIFGAALNFDVLLKEFAPVNAKVNANNLQLGKALAIIGQPIYSDGIISINADITPDDAGALKGGAVLKIANGVLFKNIVQQEQNLTLSKDVAYNAVADFKIVQNNELSGKIDFLSSLANLKTADTRYNITSKNAASDFILDVPNLKELESLAGIALQGSAKLYGDVKFAQNQLSANVKSDDLAGGKLSAVLNGDQLTAELNKVKIENILHMLVQPRYASALLDMKADISSIASKNGVVNLDISNGVLNEQMLKNQFNITLPKTSFSAKSNVALKNNAAEFTNKILSTIANLEKLDGTYNIASGELKTNYLINISDLSKIAAATGQKISGAVDVSGDINYGKDVMKATAKSDNIAGGKLDVNLDGDTLKVSVSSVKMNEILAMIAQPNYASALLNANVDFTSIKNKDGKINLDISNGVLNEQTLKNQFDITLPKTSFSAKTNADMKGGIGSFDANVLSDLADISKFAGTFDLNKINFKSNYHINVKDLSKFNGITNQKMVGSIAMDGAASMEEGVLHADGKSKILGGDLSFDFTDNKIVIKGAQLSALEGLKMMSYPAVFDAKIALDVNHDLTKKIGTFKMTSPIGKLTETQLSGLVRTFSGFDMTAEGYENITLDGKINGENINFLFDTRSQKSSINISNGKIMGKNLDIPYKLMIEKTDLLGKIGGTTDAPKVSLDTSAYLKSKATEKINEQIDKGGKKLLDSILKKL